MLKAGGKSTEFWGMVGLGAMILIGWASPEEAMKAVTGGTAAQSLFNMVQNVLETKGDLAIYAGILWAYLKRRTSLKELELKGKVNENKPV